jgi:hypothetical protein
MCMPTLLSPSAICTPAMRVDFFMLEIEIWNRRCLTIQILNI